MKYRLIYTIISLLLFFFGAYFLVDEPAITGSVVSIPTDAFPFTSMLGLSFMILGGIFFVAGKAEESALLHTRDKNVKFFRSWLRKREHVTMDVENADELYSNIEKKYWSIFSHLSEKDAHKKPLKYVEDYVDKNKKKLNLQEAE